jgi:hypothetical protein
LALRIFKPAAYDVTGIKSKPKHMAAAAAPAVPDHLRNSRRVIAILPPFKERLSRKQPALKCHYQEE